jgi:alcohol dehydrogenase (NADP+)
MIEKIDSRTVPCRAMPRGSMPLIGLGTFGSDHVSPDQMAEAVLGAAQVGYRHFDCAEVYGNEREVGRSLQSIIKGGVRREGLWIKFQGLEQPPQARRGRRSLRALA